MENIEATIVKLNIALKMKALRDCMDVNGQQRRVGEKKLIRGAGAYIPQVYEKI